MEEQALNSIDSRRLILVATGVAAASDVRSLLLTQEAALTRRNVSSFRTREWREDLDTSRNGDFISDTNSKWLQHWTADGKTRILPKSIPLTDEWTKRGCKEFVERRQNPGWAATPSMCERNPEWPSIIADGDPANPRGTRELDLSWQYLRICGTQDTRKIGRRSSNRCTSLDNEHIEKAFERTPVGTQAKLLCANNMDARDHKQ
jgi:hypothetical protein